MARLPDTEARDESRPRRDLVVWGATGILLVALFVALGGWHAQAHPGLDFCLFRRVTGVACPACGLTRAAAALARGDLAGSLRIHPLFPLLAVEAAIAWGLWGDRLRRGRWRFAGFALPVVLATAALLVLVWIVRWTLGTLPA